MLEINLKDLRFYAYHGIHDEEKLLGGEFELNLSVKFKETVNVIQDINRGINYVDLYKMVQDSMKVPTPLLETVVMKLGQIILSQYPFIIDIDISLTKLHPPIPYMSGSICVRWHKYIE